MFQRGSQQLRMTTTLMLPARRSQCLCELSITAVLHGEFLFVRPEFWSLYDRNTLIAIAAGTTSHQPYRLPSCRRPIIARVCNRPDRHTSLANKPEEQTINKETNPIFSCSKFAKLDSSRMIDGCGKGVHYAQLELWATLGSFARIVTQPVAGSGPPRPITGPMAAAGIGPINDVPVR